MENQQEQDFDEITVDEANQFIQQWVGQKAQNARIGVGFFLLIDFGQMTTVEMKPTRLRPEKKIIQKGEWFLWLYHCMWRIIHNDRIIVSSLAETKEEMQYAVEKINGSTLKSVEIMQPFWDAKFTFSNNHTIETFSRAGNENYWMLRIPNSKYLTFGPNSGIRYKP